LKPKKVLRLVFAEEIKVAYPSQASTRYRSYLPFWA